MNQMHTNGKKRFLAWLMMCAMLFNYFSGVTLTAQESQGSGNTVVIEGGSVVIGGSEPTEPLPGTATVIDRVESLLESEPEETEEATEPEVTEEATQPDETGEATQPETTEEVTQPEETAEATQPETTEAATEPEETQDVTEPEETLEATEPEETEALVQPTGSQWFLFDMATQTITGYSEDPMAPLDVIIPAQLYGVDVVAIGEMAFAGLSVTRVTVEAGSRLERVESKAFWNCTGLAVLELPEGIQVANDALEGCTLLGYGPTTADERAEDCVIYIGGVAMDASTDGTEVSYYVNGGTVTYTDPGSWNAKLWYDADNSRMTLSLNGLVATGVGSDVCFEAYGAGVFAEYKGAFCIDLTGMNTATGVPYLGDTCGGIYTKGNYHKLTITGTGTLKAIGQDASGNTFGFRTTDLTVESGTVIGIAGTASGGSSIGVQGSSITIKGGRVEGTGGTATTRSKGVYSSSGNFTVTNATVVGVSGDARENYGLASGGNLSLTNADATGRCDGTAITFSYGVYSGQKTVSVNSTVTATAGNATQGKSVGMYVGADGSYNSSIYSLTITGGTVCATGGVGNGGMSMGIYCYYTVTINGGTVDATGGTSTSGVSAGIYSYNSAINITADAQITAQGGETDKNSYGMYSLNNSIEVTGDAQVTAQSGEANQNSYGIYSARKLKIEDTSAVTATAGKAGIASYGAFVVGNFYLHDTASLTAEGGEVTGEPAEGDSWKYRSVGLWMGAASETETGATAKTEIFQFSGGQLIARSADTAPGFSGALGFYDVSNIVYTDSEQTKSTWYQWRTGEADQPTLSAMTAYEHKGDWLLDSTDADYVSPHYLCIEPAAQLGAKQVTFKIVGGTWDGADSADKIYTLTPDEDGNVDISAYIPTGMIPATSGQAGLWEPTPPDTTSDLIPATYTYRFVDALVWMGGVPMWASKSGMATYFVNTTKEVTETEPATYHAKLWYDMANDRLTLTMQDLNVTGVDDHAPSHAAGISTDSNLYVEVNGTNTVVGAVHYYDVSDVNKKWNVSYGMYTGGLTLVGSGSLDVRSVPTPSVVPNCSQRYGIYSTTTFQIDSGTLVVNSSKTKEYNYGAYCPSHAIHAVGDIVINGGSVTATTEYGSYGTSAIRSHGGNLTINGGTVNAYAANAESGGYGGCIAIYAYKTLTINDGTVTAKGDQENTTLAGGYGIYAREGGVYIHGGTVKAYGPAVFCQGYTGGDEDEGEGLLCSFGISAGYASGTGKVVITGGDVYAEGGPSEVQLGGGSKGIGGYEGVEISGGTVEAKSSTASYPAGIEGRKGPIIISGDAKVTVDSASCAQGASYGLVAAGLYISGGTTIVNVGTSETTYGLYCKAVSTEDTESSSEVAISISGDASVTVTTGDATSRSYGIYGVADAKITFSGDATVTASAGNATNYSYGIYTKNTMLVVEDQAQVEITSGDGRYTYGVVMMTASSWCDVKDSASLTVNSGNGTNQAYGFYFNKEGSLLTVEDHAKFSATAGEAASKSIGIYLNSSWMDMKDHAEVTATAGKATDSDGKSIGICEWQYGAYPFEFTGGTLTAKADTSSSYASALAWYGTSSCKGDTHITFSNSEQPNAQWYQYKTSESETEFTLSSVTAFNDDGNMEEGTTGTPYLHIEPLTAKKVIFHIEGGTWADGSTDDIVTMVILRDENGLQSATGSGSLTAPVGMISNTTGWKGFWEETPPETVSGMEEVTYTYRFAEYIVYVGGKPMYADKDGAVNYFVNSGTKVTATEPSGGWNAKLWYDTDHSRLTLSLHRLDTNGIPGDVDSKGAGIFTTHDLYVDNVGSSKSYGKVCDGAVYGIYAGNLTVAGVGYLEFNAGDSSTKDTQKVYGIYSTDSVTIENVDAAAAAYRSTDLTAAIYAEKDVTVNSGSITAIYSGSLENGAGVDADHAFGIFAVKNCYINGGTVKVTGATDVVTMGMNVAIASRDGNVEIRGGKVTATAGKQDGNTQAQTSTAIMGGASKYLASSSSAMSGKIIISGDAVVVATGGTCAQNGVTRGLYGYDGVEISGTANVTASTGSDSVYAIGIDSAYDVSITDKAHVTATAQDAQFHSYGTFVWGNFTMTGDPVFITTGGNSSREDISADLALFDGSYRARSAGMWMGITFTSELDDASNGDSRNNFTITGGTFIAQCGSAWDYHFDGALGFYSNGIIDYGSNPTWYRWETHAPDGTVAKDSSGTTRYDSHMGDWYTEWKDSTGTYVSPHYLRIERDTPAVKKVTFKIENGTWGDGTMADIELNVPLLDADGNQDLLGTGTLNVPTGMIPNTTGQTGFWDVTPPTTVTGTDPVTYTYRFADGIVWVGGQAMWATMDGTSTYFVNTTRAVTESAPASWDAKCWYDGSKLTLTVDGLDTTGVDDDEASKGAGIYTTHDLYLDVQNENNVVSGRIPGSIGSVLNGKIYYDAFGIYSSNLTIGGTGTLDVTGDDIQGSSYGIYTVGNLTVDSSTLNVSSGKTVHIQDKWDFYSYAMSATKDIVINDGDITATSNGAEMTTTAIRAGNDLTIMDGTVKAYAVNNLYGTFDRRNYVIYAENNITINDGDITAIGSGKTTSYESTAIRAGKKNITINGGNVYAKGADCAQEQSRGIAAPNYTASNTSQNYVDGQIYINGGTVVAISGVSSTGYNQGICGYNGITITGGDVTAQALGGSFSVGLYCDYNLTISNDAVITATSGDATFTSVGTYVYNNFHMSGTAKLTTTAGNSLTLGEFSPHKSKSVGLYMTSGTNEPGTPATSKKNTFTITGGTLIAQSGTAPFYTGAVAFYDVAKMTYSDANQTDDKWYQWKTNPADPFTLSANTAYVHDGDIFANTGPTFLHIEPTSDDRQEDGIVWVGGMRMDASRDGTEVCYFQNTGKVVTQALASDTPPADWNAKLWFDTSDSSNVRLVLTLDELDTTGIQNDTDSYGAGIYTAYADTLYIDLIGENKVVGDTAEVVLRDSYGIFVGELALDDSMIVKSYYPLVIQSSVDGSLSASSTMTQDYVVGIAAGDLRIENCTVSAASAMSCNSSTVSYGSFGIYVYAKDTNGNLIIDNATVTAESGDSFGVLGAIGIHVGFGDLEIKNGSDVTAKAGVGRHYNQNVYSWFIYENCPSYGVFTRGAGYDVTVTDSTLEASSGETGGQSVGIATFSGNMSFTDSHITATGGKGQQSSAGILANVVSPIYFGIGGDGKVTCDGTTELTATGEESISGISTGLWAYKNLEIKGSAQVSTKGGTDSDQSIGIFCGSKLNICEEAVVEAVAVQASDASYGVCVYGDFHMHNDTGTDNSYPKLTATAGNASGGTAWNNHSAGIWMGDSTQSDSGATSKSDSFIISSGTMIAQAGTSGGFVGAVGFYDVQREKITYIDTIQTNTTWYRWKTAVADPFTWSGVAPYDENLDWLNGTNIPTYLHIEPGEEEPRQQDAIVWVGGKPMDASVDGSEVSYFQNTNKVVIQSYSAVAEPETWNAKLWYDTANNRMTLTLKKLDTFGITGDADSLGAGIYTAYADLFYIDLIGENKVEGATYTRSSDGTCSRGIFIKASSELIIGSAQSTGALDVKAIDAADSSEGIYADKLTITGGTINVVSGESESGSSTGVYVYTGYLTVKDSTLNATSGSALNISVAVETRSKTINLSNATVTATLTGACKRSYGIRSYGNLLAEDSTITVVGSDDPATCEVYGIWARGRTVLTNCTTTVNAGSTTGSDYDSKCISTGDGSTADTRRLEINGGEVTVTAGSSTNGASFGLYSTGSTIIKGGAKVNVQSGANSQETYGLYTCANLTVADTAQVEIIAVDAAQTSCGVVTLENFHMSGTPVLLATAGKVTAQPQDSADAWKYRSAGIWLGDKSETSAGAAASNSFTITGGKLISKSADTAPGFSGALGFYDVNGITYSDGSQTDSTWYMWKIDSPANRFTVSSRTAYVHKGDWLLDAAGVDVNGDPYISTHYLHIEPKTVKEVTFQVVNGTWSDGTTADITIEIPLVDASGNPDPNGTGTLEISDIPTGMLPLPGFDFGKWDPVPDDTTPISATDPAVYIYSFVTAAPMTAVDTGASGMELMLLALAMVSALTMFAVGQTRRRLGVSGKS